MRWRLPVAAATLLLASPAVAQQPAPAPAPPAAASASEESLRAAGQAIAEIDLDRLGSDEAYAGTIADHILVLRAQRGILGEARNGLEMLLVYALASASRHDAAEAAADALIRTQPQWMEAYAAALMAAGAAGRHQRVAALVERAASAFAEPAERATFYDLATPESVGSMLRDMRAAGDTASPARLAETLLRAGYPGPDRSALEADGLRMILLRRDVEGGDGVAARRLLPEVRSLSSSLSLATDRRFDALLAGDDDRIARVRAGIEAEDRETASRLAGAPEDTDRLVERAAFLRSIGRDRAVLDLLLPLMGDPAIVVARGDKGLWLVNEAAHALVSTDAAGEGIELMRPLATMDLSQRPDLINTSINFVSLLYRTGRTEEALREAERLAVAGAEFATDYGEMIIWSVGACAAADLGRRGESDGWLRRMELKIDENPPAMIMALLCRGETQRAETVLIAALGNENWRESAILWFHDYDPRPRPAVSQRQHERFLQLRERPAVQAAFQRIGHRLRLPMADTVYGY
ncbi:MAG TPA: hypothetical protein VGB79_09070 [Allosphingosinicella sp.]|jgi:hypothetical protein